jgi:cytochrome c-type biogenesis protein CcmE
MRSRLRFIIGVGLIIGAIGYLITTAIRSTSEYYLTASEVSARQANLMGQTLRIAGRVRPGTIQWDPATLTLAFGLMALPPGDDSPAFKAVTTTSGPTPALFEVISKGEPRPDMLTDNRDVVVEGRLGVGNLIEANQVMTKCPSKYVPEKTN